MPHGHLIQNGWCLKPICALCGKEDNLALDQQETFNQLVRQNNAYRECLVRLETWLNPQTHPTIGGGRMDRLDEVRKALKTA